MKVKAKVSGKAKASRKNCDRGQTCSIPETPDPATTISGSSFPWSNGQAGAKRTFFSSMTTASFFFPKFIMSDINFNMSSKIFEQ